LFWPMACSDLVFRTYVSMEGTFLPWRDLSAPIMLLSSASYMWLHHPQSFCGNLLHGGADFQC